MPDPVHVKAARREGLNKVVAGGALDALSLDLLVLAKGQSFTFSTEGTEAASVIMSGDALVGVQGLEYRLKRKSVFLERASCVCLPIESEAVFTAIEKTEIAICRSKCGQKGSPFFVSSEMVREKTVGRDNWERKVVDILGADSPAARLVVGETFNAPGGWSSFPPHKHDTATPGVEAKMEEIYLFRLDPPEGFGTQTIYGSQGTHSFKVGDYDAVTIPWGYHPVSAMPGYGLYYLWFLSGEGRALMPNTDPDYKWLEAK
ncbi:MAG: 5-deoxy-glucuronate isomerase [Deltaproteobacteria bacterium]|nr:5-deoxy-glucuronate isomerase [Deltaproteobacteria bacterium]